MILGCLLVLCDKSGLLLPLSRFPIRKLEKFLKYFESKSFFFMFSKHHFSVLNPLNYKNQNTCDALKDMTFSKMNASTRNHVAS